MTAMPRETLLDILERNRAVLVPGGNPRTMTAWRVAFRSFDKFLERPATPRDLRAGIIDRFEEWKAQQGFARRTIDDRLQRILKFWRLLYDRREVLTPPPLNTRIDTCQRPRPVRGEADLPLFPVFVGIAGGGDRKSNGHDARLKLKIGRASCRER